MNSHSNQTLQLDAQWQPESLNDADNAAKAQALLIATCPLFGKSLDVFPQSSINPLLAGKK